MTVTPSAGPYNSDFKGVNNQLSGNADYTVFLNIVP